MLTEVWIFFFRIRNYVLPFLIISCRWAILSRSLVISSCFLKTCISQRKPAFALCFVTADGICDPPLHSAPKCDAAHSTTSDDGLDRLTFVLHFHLPFFCFRGVRDADTWIFYCRIPSRILYVLSVIFL